MIDVFLDHSTRELRDAQMFPVLANLEIVFLDHQQFFVSIDLASNIFLVERWPLETRS
jgi:hypothetical protein